jgi:hypothetical protein
MKITNNIDIPEGRFCKKMINMSCDFEEKFYDWKKPKLNKHIKKNSDNDFIFIEFSYKELGRSEEWYEKQCRNLNHDRLKIKREILLEWTLANNTSPFDETQLEEIRKHVIKPVGRLHVDYYNIDILKEFDEDNIGIRWLIGVDVSAGLDRDNTAISIVHPDTMEVWAEFRNNSIDTAELTNLLYDLVTKYFKNAVLFIERNSMGISVIDNLLKTDITNQLYWEYKRRKAEKKTKDGFIKKKKTKKMVYGINTDRKTRPKMINEVLRNIVLEEPESITSTKVFENIKGLKRNKKGKIEHASDGHDDNLFSYLMVRYALAFGENLNHFQIFTGSRGNNKQDMEEYKKNRKNNLNQLMNVSRKDKVEYDNKFKQSEEMIDKELKKRASSKNRKLNKIIELNKIN